jgi:hypothetical protein
MEEEIDTNSVTAKICVLAQKLASQIPEFFEIKGQGAGDHATNEYMKLLNEAASGLLGKDLSNKKVCATTDACFDFYVPDERAVIEIALSLRNSNSEYEKDIFKCLIGKVNGLLIDKLILVSKPGGLAKQAEPYRQAVAEVARRNGLAVIVCDLQKNRP